MKDKYLQYSIPELAQDLDFIQWVKSGGRKSEDWGPWLQAHPEMNDKITEAKKMVRALRFEDDIISASTVDRIWEGINEATMQEAIIVPQRRINWMPYAAAATVALLLAFFFLNPNRQLENVRVPLASTQSVALPDGSSVAINADSEIKYNTKKWDQERRISLEGEAFFDVEKGNPFIVETPQGNVKVLGTSFNVDSYDDSFRVSCFTGKVEVSKGGQQVILTPGKEGRWVGNKFEITDFDPNAMQDWRNGVFEYSNASLKEVFSELERQFDVTIEAPDDLLDRQYTGFFTNTQIDSALYLVTWPMRLEYELSGNVVVVR
jgi:transmembrane sensor